MAIQECCCIFRIGGVEFRIAVEIFDAHLGDQAGPAIRGYQCAAIFFIQHAGQGGIKRDGIAFDLGHDTIPEEVELAGFPGKTEVARVGTAGELIHADVADPFFGAGAADADGVAGVQGRPRRRRRRGWRVMAFTGT